MTLTALIRRLLPYTSVAAMLAILYTGWIFYSRSRTNRELAEAADSRKLENTKKAIDLAGGESLKILNFYPDPKILRRGAKGRLCYGVANAKSVKLDPPAEPVWPSLGRCVDISPPAETTYTLTATDAQGRHAAESVVVRVR